MRPALLSVTVMSLLFGCAPTGPAMRGEAAEAPEGAKPCTTDLECSPGDECIRPQGQLNGLCGHVADANGQPTTGIRRTVAPCTNDFDCPVRSHCELTTASVGVCVGQ
jgi:hypothetical protein